MDIAMRFEMLMHRIFRDKADHIAGNFLSVSGRNDWIRKLLRKLQKNIVDINTTERHKQMLLRDLKETQDGIPKKAQANWETILNLLSLCTRLLGYDYQGCRTNTPEYWQSSHQRFTQSLFENEEDSYRKEQDDAVSLRAKVCSDLRNQGHNYFTISLVLSLTENKVKQLVRESRQTS